MLQIIVAISEVANVAIQGIFVFLCPEHSSEKATMSLQLITQILRVLYRRVYSIDVQDGARRWEAAIVGTCGCSQACVIAFVINVLWSLWCLLKMEKL